jgi:RNA polymerase sigma factor (sigma-70 family)
MLVILLALRVTKPATRVYIMHKQVTDLDDRQLLEAISQKQPEAISKLYQHFYKMVQVYVQKHGGNEEDAQDVFQDGLIILFEKSKQAEFVLTCKVSTYLFSVCKNIWLKKWNKKQQLVTKPMEDDLHLTDETVDEFLHQEEIMKRLDASILKLGEPCQSLIESFYLKKLSMASIASKFGYTNSDNAKNQKYKCLLRLKKLFFENNIDKQ